MRPRGGWPWAGAVVAVVLLSIAAAAAEGPSGTGPVIANQVYELRFIADVEVDNPFLTYLLRLEVTTPAGEMITLDGFFDGNDPGESGGAVWKARICPDQPGVWTWRTVPADAEDPALLRRRGHFVCVEGDEPAGLSTHGKYFRRGGGDYIYLQGNFLDFSDDLQSTHLYLSERLSGRQRQAILRRQRDVHAANKMNVYLANEGDYGRVPVTPWLRDGEEVDRLRMDLDRWREYDERLREIKQARMYAEIWFFADDSGFGTLPQAQKECLFRYAMARTSAFSHTLYVIALEWQEGWRKTAVAASGRFLQDHNPWRRLVSVHGLPETRNGGGIGDRLRTFFAGRDWEFSGAPWATFIASQAGNDARPATVNALAVRWHATESIPHLSEEFGILRRDSSDELRHRMWANFCGGAAGGGTGSDLRPFLRFIETSGIPFQRMGPRNDLVDGAAGRVFCLAEPGRHYLVYSIGVPFTVVTRGAGLTGVWIDPLSGERHASGWFPVAPESRAMQPPDDSDWALWITDGTGLNPLRR